MDILVTVRRGLRTPDGGPSWTNLWHSRALPQRPQLATGGVKGIGVPLIWLQLQPV